MPGNAVVVVGSANMDLVVKTKRFPQPGETIFGGGFGMYPGGKGANQAVCCAKLGGRVTFVGKMGDDVFQERLCRSMARDGVRLDALLIDRSVSTGIALITVDATGQNEIVVVSGSNMRLAPGDLERKRDVLKGARVLLLQLEVPLETVSRAAAMAKKAGLTVILNPAPARHLPRSLLKNVDILTPNETEAEILTGEPARSTSGLERAAQCLLSLGVGQVVFTLGARGSFLVTKDVRKLFPARRVKAVDTTAAGDAFNGALAYSLASGRSIQEAIPFANAVAAFSVTRMGAQSSMPTMKELQGFLD